MTKRETYRLLKAAKGIFKREVTMSCLAITDYGRLKKYNKLAQSYADFYDKNPYNCWDIIKLCNWDSAEAEAWRINLLLLFRETKGKL